MAATLEEMASPPRTDTSLEVFPEIGILEVMAREYVAMATHQSISFTLVTNAAAITADAPIRVRP